MREIAQMYGMTEKQWRDARALYKKNYGEEPAKNASPSEIHKHWFGHMMRGVSYA